MELNRREYSREFKISAMRAIVLPPESLGHEKPDFMRVLIGSDSPVRAPLAGQGASGPPCQSLEFFLGGHCPALPFWQSIFSFKNEPGGGSEAIRRSGPPF